jgi:hypothetical protein
MDYAALDALVNARAVEDEAPQKYRLRRVGRVRIVRVLLKGNIQVCDVRKA